MKIMVGFFTTESNANIPVKQSNVVNMEFVFMIYLNMSQKNQKIKILLIAYVMKDI